MVLGLGWGDTAIDPKTRSMMNLMQILSSRMTLDYLRTRSLGGRT
jgi:hypothetical protein